MVFNVPIFTEHVLPQVKKRTQALFGMFQINIDALSSTLALLHKNKLPLFGYAAPIISPPPHLLMSLSLYLFLPVSFF
jgi:hypothetical protein